MAQNNYPVSLPFVLSEIFRKLVFKVFVDLLDIYSIFFILNMVFTIFLFASETFDSPVFLLIGILSTQGLTATERKRKTQK